MENNKPALNYFNDPRLRDATRSLDYTTEPALDAQKYLNTLLPKNAEKLVPKYEKHSKLANKIKQGFDGGHTDIEDHRDRLASILEQTNANYGIMIEALVAEGISEKKWLGDGFRITKTTPFDDFVNRIDLVLSLPSGGHIAIDTSSSIKNLDKKLLKAVESAEGGANARKINIGDFTEEANGVLAHKSLKDLPAIIIGVDTNEIKSMLALQHAIDVPERTLLEAEMRIVVCLLEQIVCQCNFFANLSRRSGRAQQCTYYSELLRDVKPILEELKDLYKTEFQNGDPSRIDNFTRLIKSKILEYEDLTRLK